MSTTVEDVYPLGPAQQGILFHTLLRPDSGTYLVQHHCVLEDPDVDQFQLAWATVVASHPGLRTCFAWENLPEPAQIVVSVADLPWSVLDWRHLTEPEQATRILTLLDEDRAAPLDIGAGPLARMTLVQLTDRSWFFLWTFHHLILDGWSATLVRNQVSDVYRELAAGREPTVRSSRPVRDYQIWLRDQDLADADKFWRGRLAGLEQAAPLAITRLESCEIGLGQIRVESSPALMKDVREFARRSRITVNTVVQGAWALLLARYNCTSDVVFGATCSGRPAELDGAEQMVGMFINTLPVRVKVLWGARLEAWLSNLQQAEAEARKYEHTPLVRIRSAAGFRGGTELFDTVLVFENYPAGDPVPGAPVAHKIGYRESTNYPLAVDVVMDGSFTFQAMYDRATVSDIAVSRLLEHLRDLLVQFTQQPGRNLREYAPEFHPLSESVAAVDHPSPEDRCLHDLISEQALLTPDAVAVECGSDKLTYQELEQASDNLAEHLIDLGIELDSPVGILVERSLHLAVSLLAVLKAGGAYLPLDTDAPPSWIDSLLRRANCSVVIATKGTAQTVFPDQTLVLVDDHPQGRTKSGCRRANVNVDNLVSVFYTSGSTGTPKAVGNTHRGWVGRIRWMQQTYSLSAGEAVLHKTILTFDDSAMELFWPLVAGGRVVMLAPGLHRDPSEITRAAIAYRISVLQFVPSVLSPWLDSCDPAAVAQLRDLRVVISSGEALGGHLVRRFQERFASTACGLHNQWGVTEVSIDSTAHACTERDADSGSVAIGKPITGHHVYLLDGQSRPVPPGVAGEIYLGGEGLARGYLGAPERTAAVFLPDPHVSGRVYRTGDRAYQREDGSLVFLGREDNQVKIRGIRVEIEDIEARLAQDPDVDEIAVQVRSFGNEDTRLVAFVSGRATKNLVGLRDRLAARLPGHMVPSLFHRTTALPRLANDKIDRSALSDLEATALAAPVNARPRTPAEDVLISIWAEVLGLDSVSVDDDFFMLGGHSLLAPRVISRARLAFQADLPLSLIFSNPTIARLAAAVEGLVRREIEAMSKEEINEHRTR